tara:strand:- start:6973 stop:7482 length:510 start_codon:yes stop_codon:yes gene_type:complete
MQSDEERTLSNLHVLAAVSHNDKLCTLGDGFTIDSPASLRGIWRAWYGERRTQNVQRMHQTVRAGTHFAQRSLEEANGMPESASRLRVDTVTLQHLRMLDALRRARGGIENLLQTYRDDAALSSQVGIVLAVIDDFMRVIEPHSKALRTRCWAEGTVVVYPTAHGARDA